MNRRDFTKLYMWLVIALGVVVCSLSSYNFLFTSLGRIDQRFFLLALITIALGPFLIIRIPQLTSQITVSDSFVFLTMLLYGGEAAILLAALGALSSSLRFSRRLYFRVVQCRVQGCCAALSSNSAVLSGSSSIT